MKEVIWITSCDRHYRRDTTKEPAPHTLPATVNGNVKELDWCDADKADLYDAVVALLAEHGREVGGAKPKAPSERVSRGAADDRRAAPWHCPVPGCTKPDMIRHSAAGHIWTQHRRGEQRPKTPRKCPDCPFGNDGNVTRQGMTTHRVRIHGFDQVEEALSKWPDLVAAWVAERDRAEPQPELAGV